jgi:hypothetical protein
MRDLTVLRQVAAHLDGWSDLRARVSAADVDWPSVHVARVTSGTGAELWHAAHRARGRLTGPVCTLGRAEPTRCYR